MGREKMIWGRENCKNSREKKYNGHILLWGYLVIYALIQTHLHLFEEGTYGQLYQAKER